MADSSGNVYNDAGTLSFTPFFRDVNIGNNEYSTHVENGRSDTIVAIENDVGADVCTFVSSVQIVYQALPPAPIDIVVSAPAAGSLHFSWTSGGGSTAGYRVSVAMGVSPPGDPAAGSDTTDSFYDVTALAAGEKVSIRVWANDGAGQLSPGLFATGTAGSLEQPPQTQFLIASALSNTFAQVYDSFDKNIIFTVDKNNFSFVFAYVNGLGYVNIDNGDRMQCRAYQAPWTTLSAPEVIDCDSIGNISSIPTGSQYPNGTVTRSGSTYYYDNGAVLRSGSNTWFYSDGSLMKNASTTYWQGGVVAMRSGTASKYKNNATLKSGTNIFYENGATFINSTLADLSERICILKNNAGNLFYENGLSRYSSNTFRYLNGSTTMIDSSGNPFFSSGSSASVPFSDIGIQPTSLNYTALNVDKIAHYQTSIIGTSAVFMLGGSVDYSVANGDYNHDHTVNAADYTVWRNALGQTGLVAYSGADGNGDGMITRLDFDVWKLHYGQTVPAGGAALVDALIDFSHESSPSLMVAAGASTGGDETPPQTTATRASEPVGGLPMTTVTDEAVLASLSIGQASFIQRPSLNPFGARWERGQGRPWEMPSRDTALVASEEARMVCPERLGRPTLAPDTNDNSSDSSAKTRAAVGMRRLKSWPRSPRDAGRTGDTRRANSQTFCRASLRQAQWGVIPPLRPAVPFQQSPGRRHLKTNLRLAEIILDKGILHC